mmetsp:Transcript_18543/g.51939  ORF Transcript_18543/g.51939 Transcript_18543/m.51939 type:complete len:662 (+) Transcript_18543:273-2258(+)
MPGSTEHPQMRRHSTRKIHPPPRVDTSTPTAASAPLLRELDIPTPSSAKMTPSSASKTTLGAGVKQLPGGGGIFKSAAVAVLRLERKLMSTGDITRVALERGLIKCQGKTPEATMASALYTDVKRKERKSIFTRPQEGLFGLHEWVDEGFVPVPFNAEGTGLPAESSPVHPAPASPDPDSTPKSTKRSKMTLRQRTDMRKPWIGDDDEDSRGGTEVSQDRTEISTPNEKSRSDYAMTELPGKQRLKHALRLQEWGDSAANGGMDTPDSGRSRAAEADNGEASSHIRRKKPRLHVEVPGNGSSVGIQTLPQNGLHSHATAASSGGLGWPSSSASRSPHPEGLLHALDTSRLIGSGAMSGMDPPGLMSFLPTSLESGAAALLTSTNHLRSPLDAAILGSLDTPALMNMSLPDGVPVTPEALAAAAIRSGLTPRWGLTPRINHNGPAQSPGPLSSRFPMPTVSGLNTVSSTPMPTTSAPPFEVKAEPSELAAASETRPHPAMRAAAAAADAVVAPPPPPPGGTAERPAGESPSSAAARAVNTAAMDSWRDKDGSMEASAAPALAADRKAAASLDEMHRRILALEKSLGCNHPQVGKAWLFLCRAAQTVGGRDAALRAEEALIRAKDICTTCHNQAFSMSSAADKSFTYLLEKVRNLNAADTVDE